MAPPAHIPTRRMGKDGPEVACIGFGLMGLSSAYGAVGTDEERFKVLDRAWEIGATNWDTADIYGDSEDLVGKWFKMHPERRKDIFLATKFAIQGPITDLSANNSPEYIREASQRSLKRLGLDYVDLYYVHRLQESVPIEKTIETMTELVKEGKVKYLGLSECSSTSLRRAHKVHPIAAVQVEYNPWDLAIEGEEGTNILATCRELGVAVVAYSPFSRGLLTGALKSREDFSDPNDCRLFLPRYSEENFPKNLELVAEIEKIAKEKGCTSGQLVLAWLLAQGDEIIPIPGTKRINFLEENTAAAYVKLTAEEEKSIRNLVDKANIQGDRGAFVNSYCDTVEL
ncbi:uncharacterized protein PgNI_11924 [Pyricularia grisea]|uniref:NADP-dependent oxidoreductase domain-containing protein n=1 Tax=Pyricularia grisea TaxID=148305 RepID=A0A6P8AQY8_PYRGI|nr:uncharacterized protein PgNI_11924 [Pyricularia grisea]TLD04477.1 hypothetical protein PgNI_11924 [Pyricularia grisea]